jgi:hypothetical protein
LINKSSVTYYNHLEKDGQICPLNIYEGETCVLKPNIHPCLTGATFYTCPSKNVSVGLLTTKQLQQHCTVCGGVTRTGDWDGRPGWMEFQLSWGPNSIDGVISEAESGIMGYGVYGISDCDERESEPLFTVAAYDIKKGDFTCCDDTTYVVNVLFFLPSYLSSKRFMVVPWTAIGPMDMGWTTSAIVDSIDTTIYGPNWLAEQEAKAALAADQRESLMDHTHSELEPHTHEPETKDESGGAGTAPAPAPARAPQEVTEKKETLEEEEDSVEPTVFITLAACALLGVAGIFVASKFLMPKNIQKADQEAGEADIAVSSGAAVPHSAATYTKKVSP